MHTSYLEKATVSKHNRYYQSISCYNNQLLWNNWAASEEILTYLYTVMQKMS